MNKDGSSWNHRKWYSKRGSHRGGFRRGGGGGWDTGDHGFHQSYNNFSGFRSGNRGPNNFGGRNDFNQQWKNWPNRDSPGKRLTEEEIGVTEYVSDHPGFHGIIKARYSDFQVSEINEKGEIAKLTNLEPPQPAADETVDEDEDLLLSKYNVELLPMETWDNINKLAVSEECTEKVKIDVTGMTKEQRTKIHDAVKKAFGQSIVGSTVSEDDKKFCQFEKYRKGVRIDNRVKWIWPGEYVYFIVYKENCDTMDAAIRIAERLRLNTKGSLLGYAGTKDRRAKTSQWFSARKVDPRRLAAAARGLPDLLLGNYSFASQGLKLGMLKGNRFRIALRDVRAEDDELERYVSLLRERGFVNYYGLQRFGSRARTPTYAVGLKLIQGNLREAINSILEPRPGPLSGALCAYRSCGAGPAARLLPRGAAQIEARLIRALARQPRDLLGGINSLSRNTRLLYLHAYQSLIWNKATSERLRRGGLQPMVGDLVPLLPDAPTEDLGEVLDSEEILDDSESPLDDDSEDIAPPKETTENATESKSTDDKDSKESNETEKPKLSVKVLTEEDIRSGKYTIFDIILPLPGSNIEYPPNMKDYYVELLKQDGLTPEMKNKIKSFSMSGAYRRVVVRPGAVCGRSARYSDPRCDLLLSDRDELDHVAVTGDCPDGKYKALLLTMSLPSSCYATMALRELLKVDTSCDNQALKNNYHKTTKVESKSENETECTKVESEESGTEVECKSGNGEKRKLKSELDDVEVKKVKTEDVKDEVDKNNE